MGDLPEIHYQSLSEGMNLTFIERRCKLLSNQSYSQGLIASVLAPKWKALMSLEIKNTMGNMSFK